MMLSTSEQGKILAYVRDLLKARLTGGLEPKLELDREVMEQKRGIFVTLKLRGRLRGCIGHILGVEPLKKSIHDMTLAAAFKDPRFSPLTLDELHGLEIHVSILTEPVPVKSYKDIRTGTDGIIVTHGWKKGVYLPEVATETGWDQKTFFESCALEKAGLTEQELPEAVIEIFQREGFED
ncbi:MAG: AmmeMemoRadiSam system protein A [Candidatus Omnitrophica bacterium]|nr:AmmeMemoRadiSam system protein A [Candidatus Omnitrophota bacterium]